MAVCAAGRFPGWHLAHRRRLPRPLPSMTFASEMREYFARHPCGVIFLVFSHDVGGIKFKIWIMKSQSLQLKWHCSVMIHFKICSIIVPCRDMRSSAFLNHSVAKRKMLSSA